MGTSKPLLCFDEKTALELVLTAAAEAGVSGSVVVVGKNGREVMEAHALLRLSSETRWAFNEEEGSEQLRSLQIGLESLRGEALDGFFLPPVDHPLATSEDYRLLLGALAADRSGVNVFILSHASRRGHPILCRGALGPRFLQLSSSQTAREVIDRETLSYVLTPNANVLEDMDTPEDYRKLVGLYRERNEALSKRQGRKP